MKEMIEEIYRQLMIANSILDGNGLAEKELLEEREYYNDALWNIEVLKQLLATYQHIPATDTRAGRINLKKLRNMLAELGWYISHLSQQADKIFEHYPIPEEVKNKERRYCCDRMRSALLSEDNPVEYDCVQGKYSIRCINNISEVESIDYCLWCAHTLSKRLT